jgi:formate hydrogenlyase subunit 4
MDATRFIHPLLALALAPLMAGIINRTKSWFAGRNGPPLVQPYRDLWRLLR